MTKRILAMVLVLVMVLSLLPMVSVFADSAEEVVASPKAGTHTDAGHGDDCGVTTGWLPWDKADSLPTSGNYYLTQNVTLTKEHNTIDGELNLCLNGYVIKQTAKARVMSLKDKSGAKLTICDCTAYEEDGVYYAGAVTGGNDQTASTGGGCIFVRKSTELVIYDGRFVGNSSQYTAGCILTQATATTGGVTYPAGQLTIHNGEFSNNVAVKDGTYKQGGAFYFSNGTTATIHNGIFANNKGSNGGVFVVASGSKLIIEDGKFENNRAEGNGGVINAILIGSATSTSAKVEIKGGTFTGNSAKTNGGILDIANGAQLTITGGTYTGNSAAYAGAFYLRANTVGISGATIQGNSSTSGGSAIYVYSTVKLTIGDGTVITKNTCSSKDDTDGMGAAICVGTSSADARVTLTGKVYIAGNEIVSKKFGDLTFRRAANDTLRVNGLAAGSYVVFSTPQTTNVTDPDDAAAPIIKVEGTQDSWSSGWVAFKDAESLRHIGREGTDFMFVDGHFHENVEYKPLTSAAQLSAGGAYYLTDNFTLTEAVGLTDGKETSICLNGKTLTSTYTTGATFQTSTNTDAATFNIDDCTAYTDADGVYHAGAIDGIENKATGHGGIFMIRNSGTLNIYNGKFTNNAANNVGGVAHVNGTVNVYGGYFANNTAKLKGTTKSSGGVFYVNSQGKLNAENAIFEGNTATSNGGAIHIGGKTTLKNCVFKNNHADSNGGAIVTAISVEIHDCEFIGNSATTGGAVNVGGTNSVTKLQGCTFKENSAKVVSAVNLSSSTTTLTIQDCEVTGNTSTDGYGAVNLIGNAKPIKLVGKVIVTGNTKGTEACNLHVQDGTTDGYNVTGLTAGSELGVSLQSARITNGKLYFSTASADNKATYFVSDNSSYEVELNGDNKLQLTTNASTVGHKHTKCADTGCTEHTAELTYEAWTDATSLPTEGNWYLDTDVTVSAEKQLGANTLNLCLNGHTITGFTGSNARAYSTTSGTAAEINISDCTAKVEGGVYKAGKFTGFNNTHTNSGGSAIYIRSGSHLNFFDGIVEGNKAASGGAIYVHTGTANIYNGLITDNQSISGTTWKPGGGLFMYKASVNIYGVEISGNKASYGGGVYFADGSCKLYMTGGKIIDNVCTNEGGGINAAYTASVLSISGDVVITGNTKSDGTANNVRLGNTGTVTVKDLGADARIGVTVGGLRAFSNVVSSDLSAQFPNDSDAYVTYLDADSKLAQKNAFEHIHCVCGKADCTDAAHEKIEYAAWTSSTSLPNSGSYCLTTDVTVTAEASVTGTLNLCLHGHKVTGKGGKGVRFYSTPGTGGEVLNIADCTAKTVDGVYTAGGFYDNDNTHTNSGGGAIYIRKGGTLNFYDGIVSGNKCATGGAAFYGKNATLNFYDGLVTGNKAYNSVEDKWANGGGFYLDGSVLNLYGGTITGNEAGSAAGIGEFNKSTILLGDVTITGNKAQSYGAGINAASSGSKVVIDGTPVVTGNTLANGKAANVRLASNGMLEIVNAGADTQVGVTASVFRAISNKTQDYTANFVSDDPMVTIVYQDEVLYTLSNSDHKHCICAMSATQGCDHGSLTFAPWDDTTTLPTSGNYYLEVDVVLDAQVRLEEATLNLCLNGHTVKVSEKGSRVFYMTNGATLNLTDCAGGGKLTGATKGAILSNQNGTDMTINMYGGSITDNHTKGTGGALVLQGETVFNMYGGKITNNSATAYLSYDADGNVKLDADGNQVATACHAGGLYMAGKCRFNMYGGEISGNKANHVQYLKAGATSPSNAGGYGGGVYLNTTVANLYGGKISGNEGFLGGGIFISGTGAELNLLGTEISGNHANNAGGGLISQTHAVVNMKAGEVKNNTCTGAGAGMYISTGTTLNMTGGKVTGNIGTDGTNYKSGAGMYLLASTANISGGEISYNKGYSGAAICMGTSGTRVSKLNLSGSILITGNEAQMNGGAIFCTGDGAKITMTGGTVTRNKAKNGGGIITQTKSSFEFTGGKITNNQASSSGGGVYISINTTFLMTGGEITGNVSTSSGGGVVCLRAKATFKGGSISNNTGSEAGALKISGGNVTISGVSMVSNRAIGTLNKTTGKYSGGNGGAIVIGRAGYKKDGVQMYDCPTINIYSIYCAYNKANGAAGGMLVQSDGTKFYMSGGTFCYNEAPNSNGGAIYFSTKSRPTVTGGTFYGNKAKNSGALYVLNTTGSISNIKCYNNETTVAGAAFIVTGKDTLFEMKNIELYDNVATGAAGAFTVQGYATLNLDGAKIYGNTSGSTAGAIYFSNPGYGTFKNIEIYENVAAKEAGGVFVGVGSMVTFENATIRDNEAQGSYGGGIYCRARLNLVNSKVLNNRSGEYGGGIATYKVSSTLLGQEAGVYADNCVISGNETGLQGGGIYNHRGGPVHTNFCTITDNTAGAEGGGVYADGRMTLVDATVTGNTSGGEGYAVYFCSPEFDGHSYLTGYRNIGGNMIIKDNQGGDMYLGEKSAVAVVNGPLGDKTHMEITLHSGVLCQQVLGVYNYEGGEQVYTVTAGDRSMTDPETFLIETAEEQDEGKKIVGSSDILLYAGIAIIGLAAIGGVVLMILKKKKAGNAAEKATKE